MVDTLLEIDSDEAANYKPKKIRKIKTKTVESSTQLTPQTTEDISTKRLFIRLSDGEKAGTAKDT